MAETAMRLDKYLAEMNIGSRQEVKKLINKGKVTVNGEIEKKPERKIIVDEDEVCAEGKKVTFVQYEYVMFHKPGGCVSATEDARDKTVLDYIREEDCKRKKDLFPVGRLDKDTEGLLLLTNDGELAHRLLSPKKHVEKKYFVRLRDCVGRREQEMFAQGIDIGDEKPTLPAKLECSAIEKEAYVTITEGRFHQVKRMFQACDNEVLYLKRLSMGSLELDETLSLGEYRHLTEEEKRNLC